MYILTFLLAVFIVAIAAVAFAIGLGWRKINKTVNDFARQFGGSTHQQNSSTYQQQTRTPSGDTIIDTRSPEQAKQKIFSKDEGEYVDYENAD